MMAALESDIKCLSPGRKQRPIARQSRDIDDVMPGLPSPGPKHSLSAWPASPRALTSSPKPGLLQSPGSRRVSTSSNLPFPEEPSASSLSISSSALIQRSSSSYRTIQTVRQCQEEILAMEPVPRFMQDTDSSAQRVSRSSASFKRRSLGRSQSSISRDVSVTSEYHSVRSTASSVSAPQPSASQEQQQAASLPTTPTGSGKPRGGLEPWVCQRVPGSAKSPWTAPDRNAPSPPPKQPRYIAHAGDAGYAGPAAHSPQRPAALPGMRKWRNSPQWVRIACRLSPALPPHFLFLTEPTTLQAALGTHVADSRLFSYDQVVIALGRDGTGKTYTVSGTHIAHDDRPGPQPVGLMTQLVSSLFHSTATRSTTATTVHVTAFEIQEESLTDLLQARPATSRPAGGRRPSAEEWAPRSRLAGSARSPPVKHEVFIDREGRTWVSNLTAVPVADAAAFEALRETISRRRHSARGEPSHHGDATFVLTLMVTAELPVPGAPQRANGGASPPRPASASLRTSGDRRTCSKLTFVEVGGSSSGPLPASSTTVGRLKAIGLKHALSPAAPAAPSAAFGGPKAAAAGKRGGGVNLQDNVMWAVSEVIWAAARGRNIPVPYRLCKLTRYLQDTLTPSGKALVLLCVNPAEEARAASLSTLALGARMMPSTGAILRM
ncbi:hypothetical protein WJX72_007912 [[Myrmecia] bisecta]|uniref:Kinesin motor domain-containing protein n=1 Tax=[Myrmecia] bisecta TaxID=41462 RepID=A0AAW1PTT4_9CHLO